MRKKWFQFVFIFVLLSFLTGCERPKGFTLKKILSDYEYDPQWDVPPLSSYENDQLNVILSKPFTYLGSGNHCYAFMSENEQFIIKFFKQKHMKTQSVIDSLPKAIQSLFYPTKKCLKRKKERKKSLQSYKIAYEHLKKETGIFYLHLNKTNHLKQTVILINQYGKPLEVDIDQMEFLIQNKAELCFNHLKKLFSLGKKDEALESIVSLISIIIHRIEKGFFDKDLQFFKNFGFIDNQAIEIDIGEFQFNFFTKNAREIRKEIESTSKQLTSWVKCYYPEYQSDVENIIQDMINQVRD